MDRLELLKSIAAKGQDVGFVTKKHFATYNIIEKTPGLISFLSIAFGILALVTHSISTEITSAVFIILGVTGLYISFYNDTKNTYKQAGLDLTRLYNELHSLYLVVSGIEASGDFSAYKRRLAEIENRYYPLCVSKQILFSHWYAHYTFYWVQPTGWIEEQIKFDFFKDKVPLALWILISVSVFISYMSCT